MNPVPSFSRQRSTSAGQSSARGTLAVKPFREPVKTESLLPYVWMVCGCIVFSLMGALTYGLRHQYDWPIIAVVRAALPFLLVSSIAGVSRAPLVFWKPPVLWLRSFA